MNFYIFLQIQKIYVVTIIIFEEANKASDRLSYVSSIV